MSEWQSDLIINPYVQEAIEDLIIPSVNLDFYGSGLTEEDIVSICEDLNTTTCYLLELVDKPETIDAAFDAVEEQLAQHGVSVDDYLDVTISNLESFLKCPQNFVQSQIENSPIIFHC